MTNKWICSQIGAREHYAVPRALHQQGGLAGLVTDWYAPRSQLLRRIAGRRGRAALAARTEEIPDRLVRAFPFRSLLWKQQVRRLAVQGRAYEAYLQSDRAFATATARLQLPPHKLFFGYAYASLEMLEAEKKRGVLTVLDQIDPGAVEFDLVKEELARFPEMTDSLPEFPAAYFERNQREWALADRVVVNSQFCRAALIKQGVAPDKLFVLPLCYEPGEARRKVESEMRKQESPLRVLFLGQAILRKGIQYLMAAAKRLEHENVRFDVVGPIGISKSAVATAPHNMIFHGRAIRDQAATWYRRADVFVLPTLSDGFAITQLEAMAYGLPVITTPCCGEVVSDGIDGFIVPPRDVEALAKTFLRYLAEPDLLREQQQAALMKAGQFTLERLAGNLRRLEMELLKP